MKRCPQCEFVYEDDTTACEMDGSLLTNCSQLLPPLERVIGAKAPAGPPSARRWSQWRTLAFPTLAAAILLAVLFVTYYVVARSPNGQPTRSASERVAVAPVATSDIPANSTSDQPISTSQPPAANEVMPPPASDRSLVPARLNSGPVSAAGGTGRGPVMIRFADGRSIKADEAWERKEGIWYRQGGLVTFLKRGRARIIAVPAPAARSAPAKPLDRKPMTPPAKPKEDSKIGSILKKTGRILKRPFKL